MGKFSDIKMTSTKIMMAMLVLLTVFSMSCVLGKKENLIAPAGLLLSGGDGAETSVEIYSPFTGQSCSLPSLPDQRYRHTMDSTLICGGYDSDTSTTCLTFSSGKWITSHSLVEKRIAHTSWQTEEGVVLMGGDGGPYSSEIVKMDGEEGEPSFPLQYNTEYTCSLTDLTSPTVILTGGYYKMQKVTRYGTMGFVENLPSLVVGRYGHGCGSYLRDADATQVFLVAGGVDSSDNPLSSTEVLTTSFTTWSLTTPLPRTLFYLRCVTSGGRLFATGGHDDDYNDRDEIMAWLDEEQEWVEEGKLKVARSSHAVTTIMMNDDSTVHCG